MSLLANMVRDDALSIARDGVVIGIHLPWFRSLPLSCIGPISVTLDDESCPNEAVRFRLGGEEWPLPELADLHDQEWFVLDGAQLLVTGVPTPEVGAAVRVAVDLDLRVPDILIGPGMPLVNHHHVEKQLTVRTA